MSLEATDTIRKYSMLGRGDTVLVGYSGGADSTALLHLLCSLRERLDLTVCAAHVNHGLRGREAARDEEFVRKICGEWDVRLFVLHADVRSRAEKNGETVEEAGRKVRYSFFADTARPLGAKIATAHTLSDNIETVLLNFSRGAGLKGLCGIPPVRGNIVRPLIESTRDDVEEYCAVHQLSYVTDSTNFSRQFARNHIRLDVVPQLYKINPVLGRAVLRMVRSLSQDERFLSGLAREKLESARERDGSYSLLQINVCPEAIKSRVLAFAAEQASGETQESRHIERMIALARSGSGRTQIKGGCFVRAEKGKLFFEKEMPKRENEHFCVPLMPGIFENGRFRVKITPVLKNTAGNLQNSDKRCFNNMVDCDKIIGKAVIRSRCAGDRLAPCGRKVIKTLKKLFNEAAVPVRDRDLIPVIADDSGIAWVYGFGPDQRCSVDSQTVRMLSIDVSDKDRMSQYQPPAGTLDTQIHGKEI